MAKKQSPNELYWQAQRNAQISAEYSAYLKEKGYERGPDSAHFFASKKHAEGFRELSERDLILMLVGKLPYMYD